MEIKKFLFGLFFLCIIFFVLKFDASPIKNSHESGKFFLSVSASCTFCITHEDSLFINNQEDASKDSVRLDVTYMGIERVIGIVKYDENLYKGFLDGYQAVYYYLTVGKFFFGPFGEKVVTY